MCYLVEDFPEIYTFANKFLGFIVTISTMIVSKESKPIKSIKMNSLSYFFDALPWLGFFAAIVLAWYFYLKARNKERMALIEKGADLSEIYLKQVVTFRFPWLKFGLLITGISVGVILAFVLMILFQDMDLNNEIAAGPLVIVSGCLFGGFAMIISHFIGKPGKKEANG